ncbi:MmcQ/YjbR family DNA-binding protein [Mesorhizobium xinjiangense]|uniref:MmcQ/YjbR family DNA-binding protein n=1 Tax=Mesorhizobium xinjiangense TaxID=2678685 RepID=UPI0012ECEF0E|nr:MmcQ/YjbR family DNA-binding protein [Mesorhizobium xinjiangense]
MISRSAVFSYAEHKYNTSPDYPWSNYQHYATLRHKDSDKWYALVMTVSREKLGIAGEGEVDVVNIKCRPDAVGSLRMMKGFLPAYHMNKEHWLTVLLDGSVPENEVYNLIDDSYQLTEGGQ